MQLRVRLHLLTELEGGRRSPILSDYRPDWDNGDRRPDGSINYHIGRIIGLTVEPLARGAEAEADLEVYRPEAWARVRPGDRLTCFEGPQAVGHAIVLSIGTEEP